MYTFDKALLSKEENTYVLGIQDSSTGMRLKLTALDNKLA
jgi:hypothetical protein